MYAIVSGLVMVSAQYVGTMHSPCRSPSDGTPDNLDTKIPSDISETFQQRSQYLEAFCAHIICPGITTYDAHPASATPARSKISVYNMTGSNLP